MSVVALLRQRPRSRALSAAAAALLIAFVAFTAWRLAGAAVWTDAHATRVTGFFLRGAFDVFVSSLWPLGEPQLGAVATVLLAGALAYRGRRGAAALVVACYLVATGIELGLRVGIGLAGHATTISQALVHEYPSGHTGRVPLLGGMAAALVSRRLRAAVIGLTAALAVLVSMDRVDSTLQTASDVIGGLLLGTWMAFTFAAVLPAVESMSRDG